MTIKKLAMPRRTFLRGVGVTVALPFLDAMVPALTPTALTAAAPVKRFGVVYMPLGVVNEWAGKENKWTPTSTAPGFEYLPIMQPLEPLRQHINIFTNIKVGQAGHTNPSMWLSGISKIRQTIAEDVQAATTVDQIIAKKIGQDTPFPSLELATEDYAGFIGACAPGNSCAYLNTVSWSSPTTPLPREINPRVLFERLFGRPGTADQRIAAMKNDRSILDSLTADIQDLGRGLTVRDRSRVDDYLGNIREIERRIQQTEARNSANAVNIDAPVGIPDSLEEHIGLMFDMMLVAQQADLTRVTTFMMAREMSMRMFPELGVTEPHHAMSHHQDNPEKIAGLTLVQNFFVAQFAKYAEKLAKTPDGDGTLLDHSVILYGSPMSNSNVHFNEILPTLLVAGGATGIKGDRHFKLPERTQLANLLVSVANRFDCGIEKLGDSTGSIEL